ncbi:hypothetical protein LCGC14_0262720 [marine sediment metagenome]|uniref:Uncharacterized protein n=1 Tax=marine sediment metagenome TaxID=412755 RepID=A0A0F9X5Z3_9ZZZZ
MKIIVGGDEGEWPKGTRVRKVLSEPGDTHQDGALATIVGAWGPLPATERAELILELAKKGITQDVVCLYWVEWDDIPGVPVAIADYRLERLEE